MDRDDAGAAAARHFGEEVERVKASGVLGRSDPLNRLFAYLAERTAADASPREIDIACDVLGRSDTFDVSQDATVRVYIHRLRGKLDGFYDARPAGAPRLVVPRGEYRLVLQPAAEPNAVIVLPEGALPAAPAELAPVPPEVSPSPQRWSGRRRISAALLALALVAGPAIGFLAGQSSADAPSEIAKTAVWAPILASGRLTFVVLGDYYIFGETAGSYEIQRLVREFSINSPADLDQYIMRHPDEAVRFADLDLHYLPLSAAPALGNLLPAMTGAKARGVGRAGVTTISQISPEVVKGSNVVYVGYLSGLGLLRDLLFPVSSFTVGATYDEIVDRRTGKRYQANWSSSTRNASPHLDYAYLASLRGPTGNRIIIVSGTRDAGVVQSSEAAIDPALIRAFESKAGSDTFEVLYEVRTLGHVNVGSKLIAVRALGAGGVSAPAAPAAPRFPDEAKPPR
jgi:hypothetical protein